MSSELPFQVGQEGECESFETGFRGAWFRCKIHEIGLLRGKMAYFLEFYDFPGEEKTWTELYQKPPWGMGEEGKKHLMVRPCYPPQYKQSQRPDASMIAVATVVVADEWRKGDMVDWWTDSCWWSGEVIKILGNDKVQIELLKPPVGEGKSYEARCEDLRPSLYWSPEHGWSAPASKVAGHSYYCTYLMQPLNHDEQKRDEHTHGDTGASGSTFNAAAVGSMDKLTQREELAMGLSSKEADEEKLDENPRKDAGMCVVANGSPSDKPSISGVNALGASPRGTKTASENERHNTPLPLKRMRPSEEHLTSNVNSETIELYIMQLEELVNKFKWLDGVLENGDWSNVSKPSWEFLEKPTPLTRK